MADDIKKKKGINIDFKSFYLWDIKVLILLATILCSSLSYLLYTNVLDDSLVDLNNLRAEETTLKQSISDQYGILKALPEYDKKSTQLDQIESLVNHQFPDDDEMPEMLVQVNQLAELSNVSVTNLLPNNEEKVYNESGIDLPKDSKIWTKDFTLNGSANASDFVTFIYKLAEFPRVIQVNSVSVDRVDDNKVSFVMSISVFFIKQSNEK